jgi:hypothetical protein
MKFKLFFPRISQTTNDPKAETAWAGQVAYIELIYKKTSNFTETGDRIIISSESMNAEECCEQIDDLIQDLRKLKVVAKRAFRNGLD